MYIMLIIIDAAIIAEGNSWCGNRGLRYLKEHYDDK